MDAEEVTQMIIADEFSQDRLEMVPRHSVDEVRLEVVAWLFGPKGAKSGLPF